MKGLFNLIREIQDVLFKGIQIIAEKKSKEDQIIIKRNQKTRNTMETSLQLQVEKL